MVYTSKATKIIVDYQNDPDNEEKKQKARQETMRLLYQIPISYHLLKEDNCSQFVLFCSNAIDRYIKTYTNTRASYEFFIENIIRRRLKSFMIKRRNEGIRNYFTSSFYNLDLNGHVSFAGEVEPDYHSRELPADDVPTLFQNISDLHPPLLANPDPLQDLFIEVLQTPSNRKGFLLLLATTPDQILSSCPKTVAAMYGVDYPTILAYFYTADQLLAQKRIRSKALEKKISYHYAMMTLETLKRTSICDMNAMQKASSLEKELLNRRLYRAMSATREERSIKLSMSEVARMSGVDRAYAYRCSRRVTQILKEELDEA